MADSDQGLRDRLAVLEEALQRSELEANTLFDSSVYGRAEADVATGRFRRVNECFCQITGYTKDELLELPVHVLTHPDDKEEDWKKFSAMLRGDIPEYSNEKRYIRKDGRVIWVHVAAQPVRDNTGAAHHTIGIISDITARKEAEAERERVVATLAARVAGQDKFMAMLAHELRNPLAPIRSSCFILEHAERESDPAKRARAVIERQVGHMSQLIDELLDVTRIVTGKIQLHPVPVELTEVLERTVTDHQSSFSALGVDLTMVPAETHCWANVDVVRIVQVLGNLLGNARKFTPRGGRTTVSLAIDHGPQHAIISVRDTGPGIPADLLPAVFEPFTQASTTLDRSTGGLGLGLAVVKGLVEMHGGEVGVRSEGAGQGAELIVRLPMIPAPRVTTAPQVPALPSTLGAERVLLIEDNVDAAETMRMSLELCRHQVEVAHDGPTGISKAKSFVPDIVVCDIGLPGMTGYEVARTLRSDPVLSKVPMLALSGYASATDKEAAREAGFDGHIAKPVSIQDLRDILARLVQRPAG